MTTISNSRFKDRGWIGIALMVVGLSLAFLFRKSSAWSPEIKTVMLALAYCAGITGGAFLTSYKDRRSFPEMKSELIALGSTLLLFLIFGL